MNREQLLNRGLIALEKINFLNEANKSMLESKSYDELLMNVEELERVAVPGFMAFIKSVHIEAFRSVYDIYEGPRGINAKLWKDYDKYVKRDIRKCDFSNEHFLAEDEVHSLWVTGKKNKV